MNRQSGRLDSARSGNLQEHQNLAIQPHHIFTSKASDTYPNLGLRNGRDLIHHQSANCTQAVTLVKSPGNRLSLPINALHFRPEGTMVAVVGPDTSSSTFIRTFSKFEIPLRNSFE